MATDKEKLFMNNPLKALFIQNEEIIETLNRITQELDNEEPMNDGLGGEEFYGN